MHDKLQTQSVNEFCQMNGISTSFFYKLQRQGKGPRTMKVGKRTLITPEAASEWRELMQQPENGGEQS